MNYYRQKIIKNLLGRNYLFYVAIALTMAIAIGSLIPSQNVLVYKIRFFDKFVHFLAYYLLTLSWLLSHKKRAKKLKINILIIALIFVYGIIIEVLQGVLTDNRQADLWDVLANLAGIATASVFFNLSFKKKLE